MCFNAVWIYSPANNSLVAVPFGKLFCQEKSSISQLWSVAPGTVSSSQRFTSYVSGPAKPAPPDSTPCLLFELQNVNAGPSRCLNRRHNQYIGLDGFARQMPREALKHGRKALRNRQHDAGRLCRHSPQSNSPHKQLPREQQRKTACRGWQKGRLPHGVSCRDAQNLSSLGDYAKVVEKWAAKKKRVREHSNVRRHLRSASKPLPPNEVHRLRGPSWRKPAAKEEVLRGESVARTPNSTRGPQIRLAVSAFFIQAAA
jgi:hypothetical protein